MVIIPEHGAENKYKNLEPRAPVSPTKKGGAVKCSTSDFRVEASKESSKGPSVERLRDDKQILAMQVSSFFLDFDTFEPISLY